MALATIKQVADFFKIGGGKVSDDPRNSLTAFSHEWKALTDQDREQLKTGIGEGTFTY